MALVPTEMAAAVNPRCRPFLCIEEVARFFLDAVGSPAYCPDAVLVADLSPFFASGDVNPGVIVAETLLLVAMQTDLTKGAGEYPVIKIFRTRLPGRNSRLRKIGDRLATISAYLPNVSTLDDDHECWSGVETYAVEVGIGNPDKIRVAEELIEERQWTELENNLTAIPKPFAPGIYFLPSPTQEPGDLL